MVSRWNGKYLITTETKAIVKKDSSYYRSLVLEGTDTKRMIHNSEQIIDDSCLAYGSSLEGSKRSAAKILKSTKKLPVTICSKRGIYFFPTSSINNRDCVWLAYHHIHDYTQTDNKTYIQFINGSGIYVNTSTYTIDNQMKRTSELIVQLNWDLLFA